MITAENEDPNAVSRQETEAVSLFRVVLKVSGSQEPKKSKTQSESSVA